MRILFCTGLAAWAMALAASAAAQSTTAFDGTYTGVSGNSVAFAGAHCPVVGTPGPLTISSGVVRDRNGHFDGTAGPDGHVLMHNQRGSRFEGYIDGSGLLRAASSTDPNCTYILTWRKLAAAPLNLGPPSPKFDGIYTGISRELLADTAAGNCTKRGNRYILTITNGDAGMRWGADGSLGGQANAGGAVTMSTTTGPWPIDFRGQIDPGGKLTANVALGECRWRMVWQKN